MPRVSTYSCLRNCICPAIQSWLRSGLLLDEELVDEAGEAGLSWSWFTVAVTSAILSQRRASGSWRELRRCVE